MEKSIGDFPFFIDNIGIDGNSFHSIRAICGKFPSIQTVRPVSQRAWEISMERCWAEKARDVGTGKLWKGAGPSSSKKGEIAPAPEKATQCPCFSARIL
jgi:hypothetical protein